MPTILLKKSDTPGSVPGTANLTNLAGGVEVAVNTADKRMFSMTSASAVIELGTNPSSLTCADASFTVARVGSLTISSLSLTNATFASATITNLTSTSATISSALTLSGGTANGVAYLDGSKVVTSGSTLVFDGTNLRVGGSGSGSRLVVRGTGTTSATFSIEAATSGGATRFLVADDGLCRWYGTSNAETMRLDNAGNLGIGTASPSNRLDVQHTTNGIGMRLRNTSTGVELATRTDATTSGIDAGNASNGMTFSLNTVEGMRLTTTGLGIGTSSPGQKLQVSGNAKVGQGAASNSATFMVNNPNATATGIQLFQDSQESWIMGLLASSTALTWANSGSEKMRLDTVGNLGIGTSSPGSKLHVNGAVRFGNGTALGVIDYSSTDIYFANLVTGGALTWYTNGTERARITAGGDFVIGLTSASARLQAAVGAAGSGTLSQLMVGYLGGSENYYDANTHIFRNGSATEGARIDASGNLLVGATAAVSARGEIRLGGNASGSLFCMGRSGTNKLNIGVDSSDNVDIENTANTPIRIYTNSTERARITAGGYFKASNDGTYVSSTGAYHEFRQTASDWAVRVSNTNATPYGILIPQTTDANNTGSEFLYCQGAATVRASIRSNGGLANYQSNNVDLSDARTKNSITPAASMWGKIGALEIVTYKYNDQTHDDVNVGVIAQQVESVEPAWVDADGFGETPEGEEPLKTVYTKDITFAAIKALQEAMARIEKLEAEVAALKGA